jgi:hypothetical protein
MRTLLLWLADLLEVNAGSRRGSVIERLGNVLLPEVLDFLGLS